MSALRWLLLIPVAVAAWYAVFAAGLFLHVQIERDLCPAQDMVSGFCHNEWIQLVLRVLMHLSVVVSAAAVILGASLTAPRRKELVSWSALAIGVSIAGYFASITTAWSHFTAAIVGGLSGAVFIRHYQHSRAGRELN